MKSASNPHLGSTLDDLLEEDGLLAGARSIAMERVSGWKIDRAAAEGNTSKAETARRTNGICDSLH